MLNFFSLSGKVDIELQVKKYLCAEVKIATTHCALKECFELGPQLSGAHKILKKFRRHKCGHENAAVDADTCFKSMLGTENPEHYIIASQDAELRKTLRAVTGIPLLYLSACTLFLESPSYESRDKAEEGFRNQDLLTEFEKETLGLLNKKEEPKEKRVIKRKRAKGPNPMSCKKKKKKSEGGEKKVKTESSEVALITWGSFLDAIFKFKL